MKKRVTKQTEYGYQTIGTLIQALKQAVENNAYLDMNSPVFISDYNMSKQNYKFSVLPAFSPMQHTAGLCLFHSLNEPVEEVEEVVEPVRTVQEEPTVENNCSTMKFAKWFKGE